MSPAQPLAHRYDFVLIFDVKDGNPNGDPDAGNMPRLDAESGHGLVTDVSLKRKVRNFVGLVKEQDERAPVDGEKRFEIYVREKAILNLQHERAYSALNLAVTPEEQAPEATENEATDAKKKKPAKDKRKGSADEVALARQWMCQNFFDVRTFGAVMSTGTKNCGQVRGPVQLTFARSVEPIVALEHSITVCAARSEDKPVEAQIGIQGRKHTVPYGVYVAHGFVSSFLAKQTGFGADDLQLLWRRWARCLNTTARPHAAKCPRAGCTCSSTTANWVTPRRTLCLSACKSSPKKPVPWRAVLMPMRSLLMGKVWLWGNRCSPQRA